MDLTIGKHCSHPDCHQLDFLPFNCKQCSKVFCLSHYEYKNHSCSVELTAKNTMPTCPLCSNIIVVAVGEQVDLKMDQHIRSGCKSFLLQEEKKRSKTKRQKTKRCDHNTCRNRQNFDPVKCPTCQLSFCPTHRTPTRHACASNLPAPKTNHAATRLLMRLRGNPTRERKQRAQRTRARTPPKSRVAALGDGSLAKENRFHLEVSYPKRPYAPTLEYFDQSMWFNKNHTVGRVLDEVCKYASVENRNNQANQPKLRIVHNRTGGQLPFDIPLHLLTPELNPGDTIRLVVGA